MTVLIFDLTFASGFLYVVSAYAIAFRVGWLRRSGRAPTAPTTMDMIFGGLGTRFFGFALSGQHRALGDPVTSALVWLFRCSSVFVAIGFLMLLFGRP